MKKLTISGIILSICIIIICFIWCSPMIFAGVFWGFFCIGLTLYIASLPESHHEKYYTKEQMENAIAFGRNVGISYPLMTSTHADLRRQEIKDYVDKDFHY